MVPDGIWPEKVQANSNDLEWRVRDVKRKMHWGGGWRQNGVNKLEARKLISNLEFFVHPASSPPFSDSFLVHCPVSPTAGLLRSPPCKGQSPQAASEPSVPQCVHGSLGSPVRGRASLRSGLEEL